MRKYLVFQGFRPSLLRVSQNKTTIRGRCPLTLPILVNILMKKSLSYIAAIAALSVLPFKASAQQLQSAYFMDAYVYGHQLNPAHDFNSKAYVSIPV